MDSGTRECVLCAFPEHTFAVLPCGHQDICFRCALRMAVLLQDRKCPFCKEEFEDFVLTQDPSCLYEHLDVENLGFDNEWGFYFTFDHPEDTSNSEFP